MQAGGRRREEVESKGRQAARETDEFLRHKSGAKAPAVVALSLFSSAANAFAPLVMVSDSVPGQRTGLRQCEIAVNTSVSDSK
jgi:hypothetical protein